MAYCCTPPSVAEVLSWSVPPLISQAEVWSSPPLLSRITVLVHPDRSPLKSSINCACAAMQIDDTAIAILSFLIG